MFKNAMNPLLFAATAAPFLLLAGCAARAPTQSALVSTLPEPDLHQEYHVHFPDPGHGVARYIRIAIHEDLSKTCGLMRTYFEFDSAALSARDKVVLKAVAECL
jgi:hypothetical protein